MKLHDSKDTRSNNCSFPHIPSAYSINSNEGNNNSFEINMNCYKKMIATRHNILSAKAPEGSKKLSVYDRIKLLSDEGSPLLYLSTTAGLDLPYGSIRNAGSITAITRIMEKYCIISGNDWTFKGGTAFPISVKKQLRVHEIAMENRLPCIYLVDSGGAFLPLQVVLLRIAFLLYRACTILLTFYVLCACTSIIVGYWPLPSLSFNNRTVAY